MDQRKNTYLLIIGFLVLFISILVGYDNPAKGYELSIYSNTPLSFWIGIIIVIILSIFLAFTSKKNYILFFSLFLASCAVISIISIPLIRNYHFMGIGDSLSHLGYIQRVLQDEAQLYTSRYPAMHTVAISISFISNLNIQNSMLVVPPIFSALFIFFISLIFKNIHQTNNSKLLIIGTFSAFLFLPINNLGTHSLPHPSSQAVLFTSFLVLLFVKYYFTGNNSFLFLFLFSYLSLLFLHPQQSLGLLLILFSGWIYKRLIENNNENENIMIRTILSTGMILWIWIINRARLKGEMESVLRALIYLETDFGAETAERGIVLSEVGGSIYEVFLKIFFVTIIFGLFTLIYIIYIRNKQTRKHNLLKYFFVGIFPLSGLAFVYLLLGAEGGQTQRYMGLIQLFITILGGYGFYFITKRINISKKIIVVVLSVFLILSAPTLFSSQYIYQHSHHLPETHYEGYNRSFNKYNDSLEYSALRMPTDRFYATTQSVPRTAEIRENLVFAPDNFNNRSLKEYYENKTYLAVTEAERQIDADLYKGVRFSENDFEYLDNQTYINKLQTNGEFDLYMIIP